jgi:hypothetical protein
MSIPEKLVGAYLDTEYRVFTEKGNITVTAGGRFHELIGLHDSFNVVSSAFITAYNPFSQPTEEKVNLINQERLIAEVSSCWEFLLGEGADPSGKWPAEPSILVLGIKLEEALSIGRRYQQHAILFTGIEGDTYLYDCKSESASF